MKAVTAVVVDNGEPDLEECLLSLRDQTVEPYIIVASGPKTDMELAKSLADEVLPPESGIGKARVKAILKAESKYILSCDTDTVYYPYYVEAAENSLRRNHFVRGIFYPKDEIGFWNTVEQWLVFVPYEFCLAFRKDSFMNLEIHKEDYSNPRQDIGYYIWAKLTPVLIEPTMVCYTRLPTKAVVVFKENYLKSALGALAPVAGAFIVVARWFI